MATAKKAAKKAAPKKAAKAAAKAAPKKEKGFQEFSKKNAPKNGTLVEFIDSVTRRGVYNAADNVVYENGVAYTPHSFREVTGLSEAEKTPLKVEQDKEQTFSDLHIPKHRQGENIHELSPDLAASVFQQQAADRQHEKTAEIQKATLQGDDAAKEA